MQFSWNYFSSTSTIKLRNLVFRLLGIFTLAVCGIGTRRMGCMVLCRTFHTASEQGQGSEKGQGRLVHLFFRSWNCFRWCFSFVFQWLSGVQSWSQTQPVWLHHQKRELTTLTWFRSVFHMYTISAPIHKCKTWILCHVTVLCIRIQCDLHITANLFAKTTWLQKEVVSQWSDRKAEGLPCTFVSTTLGPAHNEFGYEHPVVTSRFLRTEITDCNNKEFGHNEHSIITSSFFCTFLLVVSRSQCNCTWVANTLIMHDWSMTTVLPTFELPKYSQGFICRAPHDIRPLTQNRSH